MRLIIEGGVVAVAAFGSWWLGAEMGMSLLASNVRRHIYEYQRGHYEGSVLASDVLTILRGEKP